MKISESANELSIMTVICSCLENQMVLSISLSLVNHITWTTLTLIS